MASKTLRIANVLALTAMLANTMSLPFAMAGDWPKAFRSETSVAKLAKGVDHLERHLDECGSIVVKTPDVWGESRLMRHRSDVETQLKSRLSSFEFRINAIQSTRDAAFLATAVALQERIRDVDVPALTGSVPAGANVNNVNGATIGMVGNPNDATSSTSPPLVSRSPFLGVSNTSGLDNRTLKINIEPVVELDQLNRYLQHLNELRRLNEGDDNADTPGYALNLIRIPVSVLPGRKTEEGFGAEVQITIDPNLSEEILPLAFKDFVIKGVVDRIGFDVFQIAQRADIESLEIEVDDLVQNLAAHSAEDVSLNVPPAPTPPLSPDPSDTQTQGLVLLEENSAEGKEVEKKKAADERDPAQVKSFYQSLRASPTSKLRKFAEELNNSEGRVGSAAMASGLIDDKDETAVMILDNEPPERAANITNLEVKYRLRANINHRDLSIPASQRQSVNGHETLLPIALHVYDSLVHSGATEFSLSRDNELIPPARRLDHGLTMPEVETLLTRESEAAYDFLSQPAAAELWTTFCTADLARRVRENRKNKSPETEPASVARTRKDFLDRVKARFPGAHGSVTEALAWQIIAESALLHERLVKDMKETASLKNCPCILTDKMKFFGPNPEDGAKMAFNEYVKCKWPIHVFALDPVTQDQNISDSFSQRREMQIAIAIAASNRALGGQAMQRFVRRLEYDLETIQLNRTAIGFSHGDNTFGWRFHPRVQAPPVPSNLKVITQDLLIGGQSRDSLARKYKLEPGIRECTALVVMPSFVPQVIVDVRTNWFRLAKHVPIQQFMKRKADYEDSIDLSREVTELRELHSRCAKDAHLYRDGEVFRLCKAVERLEGRLPLQTHHVPVPWENDLGGFEVFQSGTQVLGPEVHGWYGAPGIIVAQGNAARNAIVALSQAVQATAEAALALQLVPAGDAYKEIRATKDETLKLAKSNEDKARATYAAVLASQTDTSVYLVGKNFSVLNCRVIAGGVDVTETIQVINRNLMQVRIPSSVSTVSTNHTSSEQRSVVVHLATPYGATSRLLIPVAGTAEASDAAKAQKAAEDAAKDAKAAATKAETAVGKAETVTTDAQKLIARFPILANWGEKDTPPTFTVQGYFDKKGFEKYRFCPVAAKKTPIFVYQDPKVSPLPIPKPEGTFDEAPVGVTGELMVVVESSDLDKKQKFGPWELKDGKLVDGKKLTNLTASDLYSRIHKGIRDDLPCKKDGTLTVTVTGYVRFTDDKRVVRLDNQITFKLEVIDKPEDK